jgi:hypothetical protein
MNRRDLVKLIAAATGTAFVSSSALGYVVLPQANVKETGFSEQDLNLLNEIGEIILPRTDTPGAKDADVARMMAIIVADCYTSEQRQAFKQGMLTLQKRAQNEYNKDFQQLPTELGFKMLSSLDKEARIYNVKNGTVPHYFTLMKQLVMFTFFTSEIGATKVLRYVAVPGRYDGELPYKEGERAWAT